MPSPHKPNPPARARQRIYEILERSSIGDRTSSVVDHLLIVLIVVNLSVVVLDSVPELQSRYFMLFDGVELVSLAVFSTEYALRLWVATEHAPYRHLPPMRARWKYATSAVGLIDLIAILPFWFAFLVPGDFRVLLIFRIVRFLKIARYSPAMRSLLDAVYTERRALFGCFVILIGATLFSATLMHLVERTSQPDKLGTIPQAMWWAIVTLGTVGYGDVVPVTAAGKLIASATIFMGLVMIALPVGIVATAFANEIHRRDFVITWGMVARVPLFSELNASDIAEIIRLLGAQTVEPGGIIVRRGEPAHSMYFIAAGEVEIELPSKRVRVGHGHFFGEIAVLRRARRSATVTAVARTNLLILDAHDLHMLMQRDERVSRHIHEVARSRIGHELLTPKGDIVTEEIEEAEDADTNEP